MASEPVRIHNYLDADDTRSTLSALRDLGVLVEAREGELTIRGGGLRNLQPPPAPIDVGNAGTLMRLLPGWLAFQDGGSVHPRRRRVDPPPAGGPDRRAADARWGPGSRPARAALPPSPCTARRCAGSPTRCRWPRAQVKSCVLLAGLATQQTTVIEPVPSRDHTERMLLARRGTGDARGDRRRRLSDHRGRRRRARARRRRGAGRPLLGGVLDHRRDPRPRLAARARRRRGQLDAHRAFCASCSAWARSCSATSSRRASCRRTSRWPTSTSPAPRSKARWWRPRRCRWPSTSCRSWPCSGALPRARRSCAGRPSCGSRSQTGSPPWSTACAAWAPRSRRPRTGSSCAAAAGLRGGRIDAHGDHRLALLGAVAGLASAGGSRGHRHGRGRGLLSRFRRRHRALLTGR